jgi:hypothetical protein
MHLSVPEDQETKRLYGLFPIQLFFPDLRGTENGNRVAKFSFFVSQPSHSLFPAALYAFVVLPAYQV